MREEPRGKLQGRTKRGSQLARVEAKSKAMAATGGRESGGEKLGNEESADSMSEPLSEPLSEPSASVESVVMTELSEPERERIGLISRLVGGLLGEKKDKPSRGLPSSWG